LPSYTHASEKSVDRRHRPIPDRRLNLGELIREEDEIMATSSDAHAAALLLNQLLKKGFLFA
jgi:hypothetical protein